MRAVPEDQGGEGDPAGAGPHPGGDMRRLPATCAAYVEANDEVCGAFTRGRLIVVGSGGRQHQIPVCDTHWERLGRG